MHSLTCAVAKLVMLSTPVWAQSLHNNSLYSSDALSAGAFPLGPFGNSSGYPSAEEFEAPSKFVPTGALWCVASTGTVPLTAESSP